MLVAQSCPALCNPMDCSLSGSSVHGILQAGIQEWVTIPFSGDFPNLGIKPRSPALQADSLPSEPPGKPLTGGTEWPFHVATFYLFTHALYVSFLRSSYIFSKPTF